MNRSSQYLVFLGLFLITVMAAFHLSGIQYVTSQMNASNAKDFRKSIFGVLFVHPTLHLILLGILGGIALSLKAQAWKILYFIAGSLAIDGVVAFYLGAIPPGILLWVAASLFALAGFTNKKTSI